MKKFLIACFLLLLTVSAIADGTTVYLCKVRITMKDSSQYTGYIEIGNMYLMHVGGDFSSNGLMKMLNHLNNNTPRKNVELYTKYSIWYPHGDKDEKTGIYLIDSNDFHSLRISDIKHLKYIGKEVMLREGWGYQVAVLPSRMIEYAKNHRTWAELTITQDVISFTFFSLNPKVDKAEIERLHNLYPIFKGEEYIQENKEKCYKHMIKRGIVPVEYEVEI